MSYRAAFKHESKQLTDFCWKAGQKNEILVYLFYMCTTNLKRIGTAKKSAGWNSGWVYVTLQSKVVR